MEKVVVLGGGESGFGSAVLAKQKGFEVIVSDNGKIADKYKAILEQWAIPYEEGGHTEAVNGADLVIKSPGIPDKVAVVENFRKAGVPVISEIEFAGRYCTARTICITGSNGKTTTTTLTHKILADAGFDVGLAGNIGESFAYQVAVASHKWYVIELSSFQLDGCTDFRADIGVLMNITPDHLDRYNFRLQNYVDSKFRILRNQTESDAFIYCADDPLTCSNIEKYEVAQQRLPFTAKGAQGAVAELKDGVITLNWKGRTIELPMSELKLGGIHNAYDIMAAMSAALEAGVEPESIVRSVKDFGGVEHRLEVVCEKNGILYINDSKATNVDSVWYALESMNRPVVWIAGGTDKGNDYEPLKEFARQKVKALICMGLNNEKLKESFFGLVSRVYDTNSLEQTMMAVREIAAKGDVVLLSPACASFDLFDNYEDRGRKFKEAVKSI